MAIETIDIGSGANTQTGDDARAWAIKSNANFAFLKGLIDGLEVKLSGYYVDKKDNSDLTSIEIGDQIRGNFSADNYIIADVIALPITNKDNLEIYLDQSK
jgi:hypothetical protein